MKLQYKSNIDEKANFEVEYHMETTSNEYKLLVESRTWDTTKVNDDSLVALTSEIAVMKQVNAIKNCKSDTK